MLLQHYRIRVIPMEWLEENVEKLANKCHNNLPMITGTTGLATWNRNDGYDYFRKR